jgi:hypothetical protein
VRVALRAAGRPDDAATVAMILGQLRERGEVLAKPVPSDVVEASHGS